MPGVSEEKMAIALGKQGGMGFIHFFQSPAWQLEQVYEVKQEKVKVAAAVADLSDKGIKHISDLLNIGVDLISLESANAHNLQTIEFLKKLKKKFRNIQISVSLVVTKEATEDLIKAGADSIRVGIGGGSHCTTRLVTGVGRSQLSAVQNCYAITKKYHIPLISDTGIKYAGDIAKAIVFGADVVMIGGLFSGTDECPGKVITKGKMKYKYSLGMCTDTALQQKQFQKVSLFKRLKYQIKKIVGIDFDQGKEKKYFEEGVEGLIPYKGSVVPVVNTLICGLRRSMWYQGVRNLGELRRKAQVVLVSQNTIMENLPRI